MIRWILHLAYYWRQRACSRHGVFGARPELGTRIPDFLPPTPPCLLHLVPENVAGVRHVAALALAQAMVQAGRVPEAGEVVWRSLQRSPGHAGLLCCQAGLLLRLHEDADGAERAYRRALGAEPRHADALAHYGLLLAQQRHDSGAARDPPGVLPAPTGSLGARDERTLSSHGCCNRSCA
mgnify:CR=1 FL=1